MPARVVVVELVAAAARLLEKDEKPPQLDRYKRHQGKRTTGTTVESVCVICGNKFVGKRSDAATCGAVCRKKRRGSSPARQASRATCATRRARMPR